MNSVSDKSQQRNHSAETSEFKQGMTLIQETQASDGQFDGVNFIAFIALSP